MTLENRELLKSYLAWNENMLSGTADSMTAVYLKRHIDDLKFRLETNPPRPAPLCEWHKSIRLHSYPCPKHSAYCNQAYEEWNAIVSSQTPSPDLESEKEVS